MFLPLRSLLCCAALALLLPVAAAQAQPDAYPDILLGAGPGSGLARLISGADITELASGHPFGPDFLGGIRVAAGDVNGDGVADLVTGQGPGGGHVRVFDGVTAAPLFDVAPFGADYRGGVFVAAGDLDNDGRADVLVGEGGGGRVRAYSGATRAELAGGYPYGPAYAGGVTVAVGDVNGDGRLDVITGTAVGGFVKVFNGTSVPEIVSGFPYGPLFTGGVYVAAGDVSGDGRAEIVVSPRSGSEVMFIVDPADFSIRPLQPNVGSNGIAVAVGDIDLDGHADVLAAAGPGGAPLARVFSGADLHEIAGGYVFADTFRGGAFVATTADPWRVRFTTAAGTSFTVGQAGTFTITTSGRPWPITETGGLPAGATFTDNGDGTATLAGTPAAGTAGTFALTLRGGPGGSASQAFTLVVQQAPAVTSTSATTFVAGTPGTFTVTSTGFPRATLTRAGAALPNGVTFVNHGDGTATLAGTPAAGTGGSYALTFTAANGVGAAVTQNFTLTIDAAPAITSLNTTTFTAGSPGTFTVTTTGVPTAALSIAGTLPAGVTFVDNGNGTASVSGTPAASTGGSYPLTFTATNSRGTGTQSFIFTVHQAPAFTSASGATLFAEALGTFTVTTTGFPRPTLTRGGEALPSGLTFVDHGDGTATLVGTPAVGSSGSYALTLTAANGVGANVVQNFTLTVSMAPTFTSAAAATFTVGLPGSFAVTTTGLPTAALSVAGTLPAGMTFVDNGNGTGTLAGTPAAATGGTYPLTFTATNEGGSSTQSFTLTVNEAPS